MTGIGLAPAFVAAAPKLRVQVSQEGDFALIGNTLGHECAANTPAPVVGSLGACGLNVDDTAPDLFWRADSPLPGQAEASPLITAATARSTAVLGLPPGAGVTHAFLYWGAALLAPGTDPTITVDRPGGFSQDVDAVQCYQSNNNSYQCVGDVTALVQAEGVGAYRVSGVASQELANANSSSQFAAWWLVAFYTDPNGTLRNLALFDGLDPVQNGAPQNTMLSGFLVPNNGYTAKLGIIAFEGDNGIQGDQFFFNGGAALTDAQNPANNFFNGTRSSLGAAVSVAGDLPQLTGTAQSVVGIDLDIADVTAKVVGGQTSATIQGTSTGDVYYLAGFITSISDYRPNYTTSTKTVTDINGGAAVPGDELEYVLTAINTGNDTAVGVVLTDPLPAGVTFVPGSLEIVSGPNAGPKTDAAGDDQANFGGNTVTFRLGAGADAVQGGTMPVDSSSSVRFRVTIDDDASGIVENQGIIKAGGLNGAPAIDTPTDGNGGMPGAPPTEFLIEPCGDDSMCPNNLPFCKVAENPNVCVQCLENDDCGGLVPICDQGTNACICIPSGIELCNGVDDDCDAELDEGFGLGGVCNVGVGECAVQGTLVCVDLDKADCDAVAADPVDELCDGLDNDCDGTPDNGFDVGGECSVGVGECARVGTALCDGEGGLGCDAIPGDPSPELCGDELDSDCDGGNHNGCACVTDADCGAADSGQVCDDAVCIPGCRGTGGNGCPDGFLCTSVDESVGQCEPEAVDTDTDGETESDSDTATDTNTDSNSDSNSDSESDPTLTSATVTDSGTGGDSNSSDPTTGGATVTDSGVDPTQPTEPNGDTTTGGASDTENATGELDDEGFGCECDARGGPAPIGLTLLVLAGIGRRRRDA